MHALTINENGRAEMAYVGARPWHGLGSELTPDAPIETWIAEAGMAWTIRQDFVRYRAGSKRDERVMKDQVVLYRSDDGGALGVVSDRFKVVQPRDVLEFFRDLCAHNDFRLETAGTLFGGRRFWALATIGEESYVALPRDKVKGKLLLATACDGSMKTVAKFLTERVVCNNTLSVGLRERGGTTVEVSHRSVFRAESVKQDLGVGRQQFAAFMEQMRRLADVPVRRTTADYLTLRALEPRLFETERGSQNEAPPTAEQLRVVRAGRGYQSIMTLFNGAGRGSELKGSRGTAWGWLNAVTEHLDHHAAARSHENRFNSSLLGVNDAIKSRAATLALELAR